MIYLLIVIQQTIASLTHIVGQDAVAHTSPAAVLLLRSIIASVALLAVVMIKERRVNLLSDISSKDFWILVLLGLLNIPINQFLYLEGLRHTTPANSALLYAMTPAIVFILALGIHRERTTWKKLSGIVIAFIGVSLIMFDRGVSLDSEATFGNMIIFVAMTAWSLFTLLGKPLVEKYGALRVTALHMTTGAVLFLPFGIAGTTPTDVASLTPSLWINILYLGLVASCINYAIWYYALGKMETSKVAVFQNLQPVLTTIIALVLGRVIMTEELFGGGLLTIIGVLLVQFG